MCVNLPQACLSYTKTSSRTKGRRLAVLIQQCQAEQVSICKGSSGKRERVYFYKSEEMKEAALNHNASQVYFGV